MNMMNSVHMALSIFALVIIFSLNYIEVSLITNVKAHNHDNNDNCTVKLVFEDILRKFSKFFN